MPNTQPKQGVKVARSKSFVKGSAKHKKMNVKPIAPKPQVNPANQGQR